jgi:L-erythro-3,5-diaminohexanoate dehydrogenase
MMAQAGTAGKHPRRTGREAWVHLGLNRVVGPPHALPYEAERLETSADPAPGEVVVDVHALNVDSASWSQLRNECGDDAERIAEHLLELVRRRGKLHNPVTGSGGMLIGTVAALGAGRSEPAPGTLLCSLVSLTCTPLELTAVTSLDPASPHVGVRGHAVLSAAAAWARVPDDLDRDAFLSAMDVVGAPAWADAVARPGMRVAVIGAGGKAGLLSVAALRSRLGEEGRVLGLCWPPETVTVAREAGADAVLAVDCTDPVATMTAVRSAFGGEQADLVLACANVPGCEGGAILSCRDDGEVLFFSMATSFPAAALIAESLSSTCRLTIATGFLPGAPDLVTDMLRRRPELTTLLAGPQ